MEKNARSSKSSKTKKAVNEEPVEEAAKEEEKNVATEQVQEDADGQADEQEDEQAEVREEKNTSKGKRKSKDQESGPPKKKRISEELSATRKREINHIIRRAKKNPLITPSFVTAALRNSKLASEKVDRVPEYRQTLEKQHQLVLEKCTDDSKKVRLQAQYNKKIARLQRIVDSFEKSGRVCIKGMDEAFLSRIKLSKPLSGYMLYAKETREAIQKDNPGANFGDIGRKIGEAWKALGKEGHDEWKEKATKLCTTQ